ncbi:hypothetical protein HYALB_00008380 [Hymenoscyphus albidus]|uniref:Transmembrane protein n=1 Tax=Hymenoscyphus albidus TaxID=595503 RepID=A0A9N9LNN3_9HELO|nr:hypothetical protein HYALB_00008380 [Hymenoscyphus albidus]
MPTVNHVPAPIPVIGLVFSAILEAATIVVLVTCLVIYVIYVDSLIFIIATTVLTWGFGLNRDLTICATAIYLCLICYMSSKFIVRSVARSRLNSKLYCFNCFGMLLPYAVIVIFNFLYKISYFTPGGTCIIGMEFKVLMPLIIFDAVINAFLTVLFIIPLRGLHSFKTSHDPRLRNIAFRSFVGACGTLTSSVVNLTVLMVLEGQAAWVCLICCNSDILFSVLTIHWVTSRDSPVNSSLDQHSARQGSGHQLSSFKSKLKSLRMSAGLAESQKGGGWVHTPNKTTTVIECGRTSPGSEDESDKEGIKVEIGHSIVVERDGKLMSRPETAMDSNDPKLSPSDSRYGSSYKSKFTFEEARSEPSESVVQVPSHKSTEGLVDKDFDFKFQL